jgi:hypothetical protein
VRGEDERVGRRLVQGHLDIVVVWCKSAGRYKNWSRAQEAKEFAMGGIFDSKT